MARNRSEVCLKTIAPPELNFPLDKITPDDLRQVFRLIHEVCELGADARAWRRHFLARLLELTGGNTAIGYVMHLALDPAGIKPSVELGVHVSTNAFWDAYVARGDLTENPQTAGIMSRGGGDFTCTRAELVDDVTWFGSRFYHEVALPSGWAECVNSQVFVAPPGVVDGFGLTRSPGSGPFGPREVAIVHLAHQELAHLWRKPDPLGVNTLPTRLRQTLHCIRRGLARKEIARELGVSIHTAHLYEKSLFKRFDVDGRGSLMALIASSLRPTLLPLAQENAFLDDPPAAKV